MNLEGSDAVAVTNRLLLDACPACDGAAITLVSDGEDTNFLCADCGRCWHVELGRVHRVDPVTCPGCSQRDRCYARLHDDAPDWWPPRSHA